jgi:TctA family transporter
VITLTLIILAGIFVGIITGLLPALPVYIGPFILYYFHNDLSLEYLLVFWLVVVSGSQFFGSVATITTKIPGEESSLVYLKDLDYLTLDERRALLYQTAVGSLIAGIASTVFLYVALQYVNLDNLPFLSSIKFQIVLYTITLLSLLYVNKNYLWTLLLICLGFAISPQNNYAITASWFELKTLFQGYTFFMVLLGVMIIPQVFAKHDSSTYDSQLNYIARRTQNLWLTAKSTVLGIVAGLVPGPSATTASVLAYKTTIGTNDRIVAAETANNSSVIACALPLLAFALPINQNTLIMSNLADLKSLFLPSAIFENSFMGTLTVLDITAISLTVSLFVYYFLSTRLIDFYARLIVSLHSRMKFVMIGVVAALIGIDLYTAETTVVSYLTLLAFFTTIGLILKFKNVSSLPLLFTIILGDKLVWLYLQAYTLYF